MKKNNLKETEFIVKSTNDAETLAGTNKLKPQDKVYVDKLAKSPTSIAEDDILEPEAVITPQDPATIKYLSNVIDNKTGEISQPFTIGTQKYQMVRGMGADKQIVMAVFCHDEIDDNGENIIHSIEDFERNIAIPMREKLELECMDEPNLLGQDIQMIPEKKTPTEDTYQDYKHFFVNKENNGVRKFKNIKEMLSGDKLDEEEYMGVREFKQYMNERLFGKRKKINELDNEPVNTSQTTQPITSDTSGIPQEVNNQQVLPDVKKVIGQMVQKVKPYIDNLNDPKEKGQFIGVLTDMLHIGPEFKNKLITMIKNIIDKTPQPQVAESKIITKKELSESLKSNKVIKTIKVKDIKK